MTTPLDSAHVCNDSGPVLMHDGQTCAGPVWKDIAGPFVLYRNERIAVTYVVSKKRWQTT